MNVRAARAVLTGYDGAQPRSFVVAVGSQSAGNYTLRIADHAFLGHLTVYANQSLTIQGTSSPVGQLPLLDANVHVKSKAKLLLDSVRLLGPAKVDPGGELVRVPAFCGNGIVEGAEECDDGTAENAHLPNACRPNCMKASCGDRTIDSGEQCDQGVSGGLNCTKACQAICPELSVPEEMNITYSISGRVYGAKANYSCPETGATPSDGTAVRACEADGTWSGTAPTQCFQGFSNSKILTKASWGVQINSWLPSSAYILAIYSGVSAAQ